MHMFIGMVSISPLFSPFQPSYLYDNKNIDRNEARSLSNSTVALFAKDFAN